MTEETQEQNNSLRPKSGTANSNMHLQIHANKNEFVSR